MKTTVYKSLSNRQEIVTVSAGQTVAAAFPGIDFKNAVVIVNGRERTADYVLREGDVVTIRELPAGVTAAIVTLAVVVIGLAVAGGIQLYKAKKAAEEAQKELDKMKKQSNKDDIDNRPFLRGASNTLAREKSQPYVCGRHLFTPYLLCSPFYAISGEDGADQHTYIALECGFNRQILQKIAIEDIAIKTFSDASPQEGAYDLDTGVFAEGGRIEIAQDGKPFGELTALNYKTVSTTCNDEIPRDVKVDRGEAEYLTYTLDANAMNVTVAITFPYGLYAYNDDADKIETKVTVTIEYSRDGGNTWNTIRERNLNRNASKEIRFSDTKGFSWDDYSDLHNHGQRNIILRVRSNGNDDPKIKNDCYVLFYQSRCFDPNLSTYPAGAVHNNDRTLVPCKILEDRERAFCTVIGLKVKASRNNEDKLKKINVITQGVARTWNGSSWSAGKSATSNPAAWALEILTSDSHPMSRFADGEIDMRSFGEFYEWCESNKFRFDYVVTQGRKKGDTVSLILDNCGAVMYRDLYGRLAVAVDRPQSNAIAVYNPQNIISISNRKTFGRRTDGLRVKYVSSADDLYQEDTYLLMRTVDGKPLELNADSAIKDVTVTGITTFEHVVKYARRMMALEALRPKTTTIEVGNEGVYFTPYSKVLLQDDSLKIGTGSAVVKATQWKDGRLSKILLDGFVTFEAGKKYGAIVNCFGGGRAIPLSLKVGGSGYTDTLEVETDVTSGAEAVPEAGCVVSFGELDSVGGFNRVTTQYLISNISRADNGYRLELVNYDTSVYASGAIPDYRSNMTQRPPVRNAVIPPDYVTRGEMMDAINGIDTNTEPPDTPIVAECKAYHDYVSMKFDALPEEPKNTLKNVEWQVNKKGLGWEDFYSNLSFSARYEFIRETDGYPEREDLNWQFRCRVTNTRGITSEWSAPRFTDVSGYGTWRVSGAENAEARTYGSDAIRLSFGSARPNKRTYYGSTRFSVTVKYDGEPIMADADVPSNLYYYFDRGTDGYPERHENAADGIRDISLYSFTVIPVETITGEVGKELEVPMDETGYGTWLVPEVSATAEASEHLALLRWNLDGEIPYGTMRYDVFLDGEAIKENLSSAYFAYRFTENLSAEEVGALNFSVRARNEAHERTAALSVDTSNYLGYKVEKPWIKAVARKEGIDVSWDRTNEFYGKAEFVLLKDGEEIFRSAREREFFLPFGEDEFPEKEDILAMTLQVRLEGDADSATSDAAETDVSGYLTYVPAVPKAYPSASGRNANLSWDAQDKVYDFTGCEIQIAKGYKAADGKMVPITDEDELEWYAPALGLNPYESLENYKRGDAGGRLEVRGLSVSLTLPLFGQDGDGASDTPYAFRLRGRSAAGKVSEWTEALFVVCKAVSAYDVVKAWDLDDAGEKVRLPGALGVRQIFAEELSAISANLGYITDGALRGNEYNYWAVGDTVGDDGKTMWRGAFRVGGRDQYIQVEPRLEDGAPTGEYDITFVVGNFSVSATGTQIRNGSFEVYDDKGNLMFSVAPEGSKIRVRKGTCQSRESRYVLPFGLREPQFFTVTDGDDAFVFARDSGEDLSFTVWRLGKGAGEKWWTVGGIAAQAVMGCLNMECFYATATDGKAVLFAEDDQGIPGLCVLDLQARAARFAASPELAEGGVLEGQKLDMMSCVDGQIFLYCHRTERNDVYSYDYTNIFLLSENGLCAMFPDGGEYVLTGAAVHGGYAYASMQSFLFTIVSRRDLRTGAMSFLMFPGDISPQETGIPSNFLMVDDTHVTLFGECRIVNDDASESAHFLGAARIPLASAEWNYWDGTSEWTDSKAMRLPEAWRYRGADEEHMLVPCPSFLHAGDPLVVGIKDNNSNGFAADVARLAFEDSGEPEFVGHTEIRNASASRVTRISVTESDVADYESYYDLMYRLYSFFNCYGASFPAEAGGVRGVRCAYQRFAYGLNGYFAINGINVWTLLEDEIMDDGGSEVYSAGIGFNLISHDVMSDRFRYYLDTGAFLEFDRDGNLIAQGEKGRDGKDGIDGKDGTPGRDGVDGKDGTTPEISVAATVDGGTGEPSVEVRKAGTAEAPEFKLEFKNLKGERGEPGATVEASGLFGFRIDDAGRLILSYSGGDAPALSINGDGELIYTYQEERKWKSI